MTRPSHIIPGLNLPYRGWAGNGVGCSWLTTRIVAGVAYALGWRPQFIQHQPRESQRTPLEILQARYAAGEISSVEYKEMRRDLVG